jgi:hypothetical protein
MMKLPDLLTDSLKNLRRLWPLGLLSVLCAFIYSRTAAPEFPNSGDNLWYIPTAISIIEHGTTDVSMFAADLSELPPWKVWLPDMKMDAGKRLVFLNGKHYNYFPIGTTLLSLPFVWLHLQIHPPHPEHNLILYSDLVAIRLAASLAGGTILLIGLIILSLGYNRFWAFSGAALFAFATPHFSAHARALWSHNAYVFVFCLALLIMLSKRGKYAGWSALPLAFGYIIRPDAAISICVLGVYMLFYHRNQLPLFIGLGLSVATAFVLYSFSVYGTHLPPYYLASRLDTSNFWTAFSGHLVSPNRGLFIFSPVLMFSFWGIYRVLRHPARSHPVLPFLAILVLLYLPLLASFPHWWGGHSYGPRLFNPIVPALFLLILPLVDAGNWRENIRTAAVPLVFFILFATWSIFVQVRGTSTEAAHRWNAVPPNIDLYPEKIWDWQDLQILAKDP